MRRQAYQAALPLMVKRSIQPSRDVSLEVYAYSGEATLPEQVRSLRSFLRYVGRPKTFTIVSDGTHHAASVELLQKIDPSVVVRPVGDYLPSDLPPKFRSYVTTHPLGKQLGLIMTLPRNGPALYLDSDILFFAAAAELMKDAADTRAPALYLQDCQECSTDPRIFLSPNESREPVNSGLLFMFRPLDWSLGIERFLRLGGEPTFFTNQTVVHVVMHANGARPLDSGQYVLELDDQFIYPDRYARSGLILRHYVNPVRHKFWTTL